MSRQEWQTYRAEMYNYTPALVSFRRKLTGWKKHLQTVFCLCVLAAIPFVTYVLAESSGPRYFWSVILCGIFAFGVLMAEFHKWAYAEDFGIHNLEGYDPVAQTVPELEESGIDHDQLWCKKPPSRT